MDSKQFAALVAQRTGRSAAEVATMSDALVEALREIGAEIDSVAVPGFGTFRSVKHEERIATSPAGESTLYPPSIEMSFQPSVVLRKKLN